MASGMESDDLGSDVQSLVDVMRTKEWQSSKVLFSYECGFPSALHPKGRFKLSHRN